MAQPQQKVTVGPAAAKTRRRTSNFTKAHQLAENFRQLLYFHTNCPFNTQSCLLTHPTTFSYTDTLSSSHELFTINGINVSERINWEAHGVPPDAIRNLRRAARTMIADGYSRECIRAYARVRKPTMMISCKVLGLEELGLRDKRRMTWETRKRLIKDWTGLAKVCIRFLFAGERRLCEQIFDGLDAVSITDACFMNTVEDSAVQLLNFAKRISLDRPSISKFFTMLDTYHVLSDLLSDIKTVFGSISGESIRIQANEILPSIAKVAMGSYSEFQDGLIGELSHVTDSGVVHGLTRYVMKYILEMVKHRKTLSDLLVSDPRAYSSGTTIVLDFDFSEFAPKVLMLGLHLIWIMENLLHKLQQKSMEYKDASMAHLFMMNNMHYIVEKIEQSSKLWKMIGYEYSERLTEKYRLSVVNYQKSAWGRMLNCLRDDGGLKSFLSVFFTCVVRRRFRHFNGLFEKVLRTHSEPDTKLPKELMIIVLKKIIPAYRSFLDKYRVRIDGGKHPEKYIKYSVEELEKAIMQLFKN